MFLRSLKWTPYLRATETLSHSLISLFSLLHREQRFMDRFFPASGALSRSSKPFQLDEDKTALPAFRRYHNEHLVSAVHRSSYVLQVLVYFFFLHPKIARQLACRKLAV